MNPLLVLPVLVPFAAAALALVLRNRPTIPFRVSLTGAVVHLAACLALLAGVHARGIQVLYVGSWPAPFGITLVADHLSALLAVLTGIVSVCATAFSRAEMTRDLEERGYPALVQILTGGISGAFLTGDLFNLYVWFEVMLMASFALLVIGGGKRQLDAGVRYVTINLMSTLLFLSGLGLVYAMTGTLNMADLHQKMPQVANRGLVAAVAVVFLTAFGIKAGMFPLFFWLPASYHTPPVAVSAIFSGLLTKVGVYAMIRTFTLVFSFDDAPLSTLLPAAAALTMLTGVLGAAAHGQVRRILSFHIISQVGYMILGLAVFTPLALAGTVFYLLHHIVVKANLFLISGLIRQVGGSFRLSEAGGIYRSSGLVSVLFFIPAFSLAGFPPLSGFWAKMMLIRASLEAGQFLLAAVAVVVGLLTAYSMTKIWEQAFWKPAPAGLAPAPTGPAIWMVAPVAALAALTVVIGVAAEPFCALSLKAAEELLNPAGYVSCVLGGGR